MVQNLTLFLEFFISALYTWRKIVKVSNMLYCRLSQSLFTNSFVRLASCRSLFSTIRYLHEDRTGPDSEFKKLLLQQMKKNAELKTEAAKEKQKTDSAILSKEKKVNPPTTIDITENSRNLYGSEFPVNVSPASKGSLESNSPTVSQSQNKDSKLNSNVKAFEKRTKRFVESALRKRKGSKRQLLTNERMSKKLKIEETQTKLENKSLKLSKEDNDKVKNKPVEQSKSDESLGDEKSHAEAKAELARSIIAFKAEQMISNEKKILKEQSKSNPEADKTSINLSGSENKSNDRIKLGNQGKSEKNVNRKTDRNRTSTSKNGFERFMTNIKDKNQQAPKQSQTPSDSVNIKSFMKSRFLEYISKARSRAMQSKLKQSTSLKARKNSSTTIKTDSNKNDHLRRSIEIKGGLPKPRASQNESVSEKGTESIKIEKIKNPTQTQFETKSSREINSNSTTNDNSKQLSKTITLPGTISNKGVSIKSESEEPKLEVVERDSLRNKPTQNQFETKPSTATKTELDTKDFSNISNKHKKGLSKSKTPQSASSGKSAATPSEALQNTSSFTTKIDEELIKAKKLQNLQSAKKAKEAKSKSIKTKPNPTKPNSPSSL